MAEMKMEFPDSFFEEEIRCGYTVKTEMKKVWAVELDLLNELLRVCKKHQIVIVAAGGTMLGAVRHKGFIPWDDDIDMIVSREDYVRLCQIAADEFAYPYFFQTEYTDAGSMRGHAQLRNSSTTGILKEEGIYAQFNQGIFIDIFPMDAVVEDAAKYEKQGRAAQRYRNLARKLYMYTDGYENIVHTFVKNLIHIVANIMNCIYNYNQWYARFEKICTRYNQLDTEMVSSLSFMFWEKRHQKFRRDYEKQVEMDFEMLKIPVAYHYEHALEQEFGDWKKIIMDDSNHGNILFDTEKSYLEYTGRKTPT